MGVETLRIDINANSKQAIAEYEKLRKSQFNLTEEIKKYQSLAFTEKDGQKVAAYNRRIQELQITLKQTTNVGKEGFDSMGVAVDKAGSGLGKAFSGLRQIAYIIPGLGIAGIFNLAFEAIGKAAEELGIFSNKAKEAAEDQKKFNQELDKEAGSAIKTGATLQIYLGIARDTTKSLAERNEALRKANELYGDHNNKLTLANINTKAVKDQVEGYTQALIANAIAAKYGDRLADSYAKQRTAAREYGQELEKLKKLEPGYKSGMANNGGLVLSEGGSTQDSAVRAYELQFSKVVSATKAYKEATEALNIETGDYVSVLTEANKLDGQYNQTHEKGTKEVKKKAKAYDELAAFMKLYYQTVGLRVGAVTVGTENDPLSKLAKPITNIKESDISKRNEGDLKREQDLKSLNEQLALSGKLAMIGADAFGQLFSAMTQGESIGEAISNVFKDLVKQLALAVVKAITFAVILNVITGGAYSIGKIFVGALGGNFTGKGYSSGGLATGPESGHMELLHGNEWVLRPDQLNGALNTAKMAGAMEGGMGGGLQLVRVEGIIRGNDIYLSKQRTDYQRGLTTGIR